MTSFYLWLGHWYLVRARRAELHAIALKKKAEETFLRITSGGSTDDFVIVLVVIGMGFLA